MRAVPNPSHPIDALYRCHYHICVFTGSAKFPPEKHADQFTLANGDAMHG